MAYKAPYHTTVSPVLFLFPLPPFEANVTQNLGHRSGKGLVRLSQRGGVANGHVVSRRSSSSQHIFRQLRLLSLWQTAKEDPRPFDDGCQILLEKGVSLSETIHHAASPVRYAWPASTSFRTNPKPLLHDPVRFLALISFQYFATILYCNPDAIIHGGLPRAAGHRILIGSSLSQARFSSFKSTHLSYLPPFPAKAGQMSTGLDVSTDHRAAGTMSFPEAALWSKWASSVVPLLADGGTVSSASSRRVPGESASLSVTATSREDGSNPETFLVIGSYGIQRIKYWVPVGIQ